MKRIKMCLCVLAVMICLTGCESLRFEPGQLQKQNAYLHDRATNIAAETARVEKSSEKLQKLTRLTAQQSRAFVSYMGLPDKLPRAVMAEEVLVESSFQIAEQAEVDSQRRFDGWQVADGVVEFGIAVASLFGGVYGLKFAGYLKQAREKSQALKEIVAGNELFKQYNSEAVDSFKNAQSVQSAKTKEIVAKMKTVS